MKIGALLLSQFGLLAVLNSQLFGMVTAYKMMELKGNLSLTTYLSARKTYLQRKRRYLQAHQVHGFPDSLVLFTPAFSVTCIGDLLIHLSTCYVTWPNVTWPKSKCYHNGLFYRLGVSRSHSVRDKSTVLNVYIVRILMH